MPLVVVGVMEVHRGRAEHRISTAVRDVREVAEAFQTFDFDTFSIHDQRVCFEFCFFLWKRLTCQRQFHITVMDGASQRGGRTPCPWVGNETANIRGFFFMYDAYDK